MSVEEQLRAYGRTIQQRRVPIVAQEVFNDETLMFDPTGNGEPRPPRSRWILSAAAVTVLATATVGLFTFGGGDSEPSDTPIDSPPTNPTIPPTTVPETTPATTTATETTPSTTIDASPIVTPESTTGPPESLVPPESTGQSETDTADSGSEQPPALQRPVSGQTQRSVVGDITWTLFEGDASNVPEGPFIGVDGWYLGGVDDGRTWRSSDGIEWELVDLGGDGVADEEVFGEFVFAGETWARTERGPRLVRWDGETFVPVALPESRVVGLDGLRVSRPWVEAPVVLGDELVVPVNTYSVVPWDELFAEGAQAEWAGDPQAIRIVDTSGEDGPLPVLAVLSAEFIDGEPGRFEFRDVESNELVTTVEAIPGVDPAEFLPRIIDGRYFEILIGDADGFEAVEPPGGWGVPASLTGEVVPIDGGVLGIAQQGYATLTSDDGKSFGADAWELWTSSDARSWTRLDLPTPSGSNIDIVRLASDGSTAILTIYSHLNVRGSTQDVESWATVDGRQWQKIDTTALIGYSGYFMGPAEFGWFASLDERGIALSPDGGTWQEVRFDFPQFGGAGSSVVGRSIFVIRWPGGPARSLWIGHVADR